MLHTYLLGLLYYVYLRDKATPFVLEEIILPWFWLTLCYLYGKPFYYLLSKIDILYIRSDILYRI